MQRYKKINDEVYYLKDLNNSISSKDIEFIKQQAFINLSQKCRICTHEDPNDILQEMFIVHTDKCFVRPHYHCDKEESIQVLEGMADLYFFDSL